jgi:gliding motility-associated-like protein
MYYPNSFIPENCGYNNFWRPQGIGISENSFLLNIYDQNENLIFQSTKYYFTGGSTAGWDGTINNTICPFGYYYFVCKYQDMRGYRHKDSGMLMLIR